MSDLDDRDIRAALTAREIRMWTGQPKVGLWCPTCLLPSGYEVPFYRDPAADTRPCLTVRRCFDDADHRLPKEAS